MKPYSNKFNNIKNKSFIIIEKINDNKYIIYPIMIIVYFFLYLVIYTPIEVEKSINNSLYNFSEEKKNNNLLEIIIVDIVICIFIILIYIFSIITQKNNYKIISLVALIILIFSIFYYNFIIYFNELIEISISVVTKIFFLIFSIIFYILLLVLFFYNIDNKINVEFIISIEILFLFSIKYMMYIISSIRYLYYQLQNNDFSTISINCIPDNYNETYLNNTEINQNPQLIYISEKYGNNYLKTIGTIPISFYIKKYDIYQDLILADFYYPGSYYSYLSDTPLNGTPNLNALKIVLSDFKVRIVHLDIFSDKIDNYDPTSLPVVRCANIKPGKDPLQLEDCLGMINKWAWITDNNNNSSYPFFLYLNFNFEESNENIYIKIYYDLIKFFSKYFVDKKYSFCGRNNTFPISNAKMKDCLGKIIIITNRYPTKTILDELINSSISNSNININIYEYKQSYIEYDKLGISQDNDKNDLIKNSQKNINFYYSNPNEKYKNDNQEKAGLFNPSFQDCAQYGIQSTLMYIFVPDINLNKWNLFFKNKNNLNPVLKEESLRLIKDEKVEIKKQKPILALQEPQKYCVVPGLISTDKSNLSDGNSNTSCSN